LCLEGIENADQLSVFKLVNFLMKLFSKVKPYVGSFKKRLFKFGYFSNTIRISYRIKLILLSKKP